MSTNSEAGATGSVRVVPGFDGTLFVFCTVTGVPAIVGGPMFGVVALVLGMPSWIFAVTISLSFAVGAMCAARRPALLIHDGYVIVTNMVTSRRFAPWIRRLD